VVWETVDEEEEIMDKVEFYRDAQEEWRWTRTNTGNYEVVGASSEGYTTYRNCYDNAYSQFGDTVEYVKWAHEATGDPVASMEVEDDDGGTPSDSDSEGTE
jgi:uncharacterized protein YegP (UPF0339 family)